MNKKFETYLDLKDKRIEVMMLLDWENKKVDWNKVIEKSIECIRLEGVLESIIQREKEELPFS